MLLFVAAKDANADIESFATSVADKMDAAIEAWADVMRE